MKSPSIPVHSSLLCFATLLGVLLAIMIAAEARAQEGPLDKSAPTGITVEEIVKRFSIKEKQFKEARDQYTYRQDVRVMTLDGDTPDGAYQQVFDVTFDDKGRRIKNVVFAPQPTLQRIQMTEEDFDAVIAVHLKGSWNVSRAAAPHFKIQQRGAMVHMTSSSGLIGNVGQVNYCAAKMGIVGMSKAIALDMERFGVRSKKPA